MTDVTIRGIDDQIYNQFSGEARKRGVSIGELATQAMAQFLQGSSIPEINKIQSVQSLARTFKQKEERPLTIAGFKELIICREDLEETGQPVVFFEIQRLIFEEDVTREVLEKFVFSIVGCQRVEFFHDLPKLYVYSKCVNANEIIRHKTDEGE